MSRKIWQTLERVNGLAAVTAEWQALLASDYEAFRKFLRPTSQHATCYPCLATPPCGCAHEVIIHAPNDIVAVCRCEPQDCETTAVQRQDLVIYEVNLGALGESIASTLGLVRDNTVVADLRRTLRVGTYCPLPGYRVPVYLTIQLEPDDFQRVVETLVVDNDEPFVLLAPTQELFSPACEKRLQKRKAQFLPLADTLAWQQDGTLIPRVPPEALLSGMQKAMIPPVQVSYDEIPSPESCFILQGHYWSVTYQGKTCSLKDAKGMGYLEILLRKQGHCKSACKTDQVFGVIGVQN